MKHLRKCFSCGEVKVRTEMIRITKDYRDGKVVIKPNAETFGRSLYLCYNQNCINNALKKNKLNRALKTDTDLKGLLDGQFKG